MTTIRRLLLIPFDPLYHENPSNPKDAPTVLPPGARLSCPRNFLTFSSGLAMVISVEQRFISTISLSVGLACGLHLACSIRRFICSLPRVLGSCELEGEVKRKGVKGV